MDTCAAKKSYAVIAAAVVSTLVAICTIFLKAGVTLVKKEASKTVFQGLS